MYCRMIHAVEINIHQLQHESEIYKATLLKQQQQQYNTATTNTTNAATLAYYKKEHDILSASVRVHEQELGLLQNKWDTITKVDRMLSQQEEQLQKEYRNLEFTNLQQMMAAKLPKVTNYLQRAQDEYDAISSIKLPFMLFDILPQYSMINYLRLAHKPNSQKHLKWEEINVAWSQAAQLLYMVGGRSPSRLHSALSWLVLKH